MDSQLLEGHHHDLVCCVPLFASPIVRALGIPVSHRRFSPHLSPRDESTVQDGWRTYCTTLFSIFRPKNTNSRYPRKLYQNFSVCSNSSPLSILIFHRTRYLFGLFFRISFHDIFRIAFADQWLCSNFVLVHIIIVDFLYCGQPNMLSLFRPSASRCEGTAGTAKYP